MCMQTALAGLSGYQKEENEDAKVGGECGGHVQSGSLALETGRLIECSRLAMRGYGKQGRTDIIP